MKDDGSFDLDEAVQKWRIRLRKTGATTSDDLDELESHLRDEIRELSTSGLSTDEAFIIAVRRIGNVNAVADEFAKVNLNTIWKQLFEPVADPVGRARVRRESIIAIVFTCAAALAATVLLVNTYPYRTGSDTELLTIIHLPIMLWLILIVVYTGNEGTQLDRNLDFLTFTGEAFIYTILIVLGGGVLVGITQAIFTSIGLDMEETLLNHMIVPGGVVAPVLAVYLAEAKRTVIENIAPVLARIFVPLFCVVLSAFLVTLLLIGQGPHVDRALLIALDLLLVFVLAMIYYSLSARPSSSSRTIHDIEDESYALLVVALILDIVCLTAIIRRLASFGFSPNKIAALGENILLFIQLAGLSVTYGLFLIRRNSFRRVELWMVGYLPVYLVWFIFIIAFLPLIFDFA